jgi:hypothetical protein
MFMWDVRFCAQMYKYGKTTFRAGPAVSPDTFPRKGMDNRYHKNQRQFACRPDAVGGVTKWSQAISGGSIQENEEPET